MGWIIATIALTIIITVLSFALFNLLKKNENSWVRIPMFNAQARSLNLANCVSIVLYDALRQQRFAGELDESVRI